MRSRSSSTKPTVCAPATPQRYGADAAGSDAPSSIDPASDFLKVVHTFPDLGSMAAARTRPSRVSSRALPGRKIVLTNGPEALRARGAGANFVSSVCSSSVIAIEHMRDRRRAGARSPTPRCCARRCATRHVRLQDAILVEDTRSHLKNYKRLGIRTVWITGHLPRSLHADGVPTRLPGTGRPHYVDRSILFVKIATTEHPLGSSEAPADGTTAMQPIDKLDEALTEHEPAAPAAPARAAPEAGRAPRAHSARRSPPCLKRRKAKKSPRPRLRRGSAYPKPRSIGTLPARRKCSKG